MAQKRRSVLTINFQKKFDSRFDSYLKEEGEGACMLMILGSIHDEEKCNRLEALYNDHCSSMYTVAYRILNDKNLAEDAVQEAFINISKNLDKM